MGQDVDDCRYEKDGFRDEQGGGMDGQALEIFLDVRLLNLGLDALNLGSRQKAVFPALVDHPDHPALPLGRPDEKPRGLDKKGPDPFLEVSLLGQKTVEAGRQEGKRQLSVIPPGSGGDVPGALLGGPARPDPADHRLGDPGPPRPQDVAGTREHPAAMAAKIVPAPDFSDERSQNERKKPERILPPNPPRPGENKQERRSQGQSRRSEEKKGEDSAFRQDGGRPVVGDVPDPPALAESGHDPPAEAAGKQPDMMMRPIDKGIAVGRVLPLQFLQGRPKIGEVAGVFSGETLELPKIALVELDEPAPPEPPENELEIDGALRVEGRQGHPRPEIDGGQPGPRVGIGGDPFHGIGLAFQRSPFVLAGQLLRSHPPHHRRQPFHEFTLRPVFRGPDPVLRIAGLPTVPGIEVVIDFKPPHSAVHPFAELAVAAEPLVAEGADDVGHSVVAAELHPGGPADEFLPEGLGAAGRGQRLERKRGLKAEAVEKVPDAGGEARRRNQDFQGVGPPGFQPFHLVLDRDDRPRRDLVDLAGEAAPGELEDFQGNAGPGGRPNAAEFVF